MKQDKTPLLDAINQLIDSKPAYFRIPGHRLDKGISSRWTKRTGTGIFAYDVTETPYTDDLHCPEGAIKEAQELLAELYKADRSFFLVNGTTCGNEAMILTAVHEGQKIMVARNAHKSAMMGLIISGAEPVYVMPDIIDEWGIQGGISPGQVRKTFEENPECKALFMVSPSYYGVVSDIEEIARICHEYGALLLVDEAHGGHVYFGDRSDASFPKGALECGADMCVQSMHKVTGALTQSSVLHVKLRNLKHQNVDNSIDIDKLCANLHIVQSTSPNYILMTSLDCARYELAQNGKEMVLEAKRLCEYAREKINAISGFRCMGREILGEENFDKISKNSVCAIDTTRLVISAKDLGITGFELDEILFTQYQVNMELSDFENVVAVVTYANTVMDMDRLVEACRKISQNRCDVNKTASSNSINKRLPGIPVQKLTPRQAYFTKAEEIDWKDSVGKISAEMIAPYPPGIPIIYPGEVISQEIWDYLEAFRRDGRHIHGSKDGKLNKINVCNPEGTKIDTNVLNI